MMEFRTAGERLLRRRLRIDRILGTGVPHFVPGQLQVHVTDPKTLREFDCDDGLLTAEISYVDSVGVAVSVLIAQDEDLFWRPLMYARAGQVTTKPWGEVPVSWRLTPEMIEKLDAAIESGR